MSQPEPDHVVLLTVKRYVAEHVVGVRMYVQAHGTTIQAQAPPRILRCESV